MKPTATEVRKITRPRNVNMMPMPMVINWVLGSFRTSSCKKTKNTTISSRDLPTSSIVSTNFAQNPASKMASML